MVAIDISAEIAALCEKFGVVYENVAEMILRPTEAEVTVYKLNENGSEYVVLDKGAPDYGEAAVDNLRYSVRT